MKYATALAFFRRIAKLCGFGEKFTPRSHRAVLPTWAAQLGWRKEDRAALGRRGPNSEMPNWYDRADRNAELRVRNEIIQKAPTRVATIRRFRASEEKAICAKRRRFCVRRHNFRLDLFGGGSQHLLP